MSKKYPDMESLELFVDDMIALKGADATIKLSTLKQWMNLYNRGERPSKDTL